jgi:hypothetical protein
MEGCYWMAKTLGFFKKDAIVYPHPPPQVKFKISHVWDKISVV